MSEDERKPTPASRESVPTLQAPTNVVSTGTPSVTDLESTIVYSAAPPREGPLTLDALDAAGQSPRYELGLLLGRGGTAVVYSAYDTDLARRVAVKVVEAGSDSSESSEFLREARVTASLEHPNIAPLYDVGRTQAGRLFLTMRQVTGRSLGACVREAIASGRREAMPLDDLLNVFIKVSEALSYAHHKGVIHQDIKPDNIMLGEFGEVMVVDWGAASRRTPRPPSGQIVGTPLYMSPEQALGEPPSPGNDVFSMVAALYYAVLLRHPLRDTDSTSFWQKRIAGVVDWPPLEELEMLPRALIATLRRGLAASPADRHPSAEAFAADLKDVRAGRSKWFLLHGEALGQDFESRWRADARAFRHEPGRLVSIAEQAAVCMYRQRLSAALALEFDGEILNGAPGGDLSVVWVEDEVPAGDEPILIERLRSACTLQVGAYGNRCAAIYRNGSLCLDMRRHRLEIGCKYRIRAEIDEKCLRISVDDEVVCEYLDMFPFTSGYIGLYGYYPGKAFSNIKLFSRGLPELVSSLSVGDSYYQNHLFQEAARQYRRVAETHGRSPLAEEARYKEGLSWRRSGDRAAAERANAQLSDIRLRHRAELDAVDDAFARGEHEQVCATLIRVIELDPALAADARKVWSKCVNDLLGNDAFALEPYVALREAHFSQDPATQREAARAFNELLRFEEVLSRFPDEVGVDQALSGLGREAEVTARFNEPWIHGWSMLRRGRLSDITEADPLQALLQFMRGDPSAALAAELFRCPTLLFQGNAEEVLREPNALPDQRACAFLMLGRVKEAAALEFPNAWFAQGREAFALERARRPLERYEALLHLLLTAYRTKETANYERYRACVLAEPWSYAWDNVWFANYLMLPFLADLQHGTSTLLHGLRDALAWSREVFGARLWFAARFMLGQITADEFRAQPIPFGVEARLHLCAALRCEAHGEPAAALAEYRAYAALPATARLFDWYRGNPLADRFVEFRITELQQAR